MLSIPIHFSPFLHWYFVVLYISYGWVLSWLLFPLTPSLHNSKLLPSSFFFTFPFFPPAASFYLHNPSLLFYTLYLESSIYIAPTAVYLLFTSTSLLSYFYSHPLNSSLSLPLSVYLILLSFSIQWVWRLTVWRAFTILVLLIWNLILSKRHTMHLINFIRSCPGQYQI